jgi:3-keto-5-aminohexanoate cleavage enzyme
MYREVVERIRDGSDMICQITTGGGGSYGIPLEERMRSLELSPEFVSLNVATMTFGNRVFLNPPESVEKMARIMLERNVKAEIECYDVGHISLAIQLVQKGLFREPLRFGLVLGVTGGIPGTPENLMHMVKCLPPSASWNVIAVGGRIQFPLLTLGMILGGDVRVGMEDNIYLSKGVLARSNAELVAKVARIARELGVEIATPAQARRLLRLGLYGANVM